MENTLSLANKLYDFNRYESAVKHFRRAAFFGNDSVKAEIYPKIAQCYFLKDNYEQSLFFYNLSINTTTSDSLYNEYLFSRILCHILLNNLDFALQDIYSFNDFNSQYFTERYYFYLGVISLKRNETDQSLDYFLRASGSEPVKNELMMAYKGVNLNKPNPKTAKIFSILIPGSGQLYAGDSFNAANSFILNAGLVGVLLTIATRQSFIDAVVSIGPWLQRYYTGGYTNAGQIATRRQIEKRDVLLERIYTIFED